MSTVLEIEQLRFGHTKKRILYDDFSLRLQKGELKAIVGESGAGKSTLFELILGNLKPQSGTITAKRTAEVFQDPYSSFHPSYTLKKQIADVAPLRELELFCEMMNLDVALLEKLPHKLSGGQLQRASILRAMLMEPELLLLDEPTSALDNIVQLDVMKMLIEQLPKMGMLLITHDMDLAKWCADEVIVI